MTCRYSRCPGAALLASAFFLLTGCAGESGAGDSWVVRDSAGITIVENDHTRPALGEAGWRLSEEPVVRIGELEAEDAGLLFRVTDARRLGDGSIAVVNSGTAEVRIFDEHGRHRTTIGGRGDGPGEFRSPWRVHELPGDSLLVVDLYRHISIFGPDRSFARLFRPEITVALVHPPGEPVGQFGDGTLLFRGHYPLDPTWTGLRRSIVKLMRYGLDGTMLGSLGDFENQTILYRPDGLGTYAFGPWAREATGDSTMWYAPGDRFELREVTYDGRTLRVFRLDRPRRAVTDADIALYRESVRKYARGTREEALVNRRLAETEFPSHFPAHGDILVDEVGNLWVQDYQHFSVRMPRAWSVFDPEGRYLGNVEVPAGLRVHQIGEDFLLGQWRDELDVEYVYMYRLEKRDADPAIQAPSGDRQLRSGGRAFVASTMQFRNFGLGADKVSRGASGAITRRWSRPT